MRVVVRLVQHVSPGDWGAYFEFERRFAELEQRPGVTRGRRLRPITGAEPIDTLEWEAEFPSLEDAIAALEAQAADTAHDELFAEQARFMVDRRVELYEILEFSTAGSEP